MRAKRMKNKRQRVKKKKATRRTNNGGIDNINEKYRAMFTSSHCQNRKPRRLKPDQSFNTHLYKYE